MSTVHFVIAPFPLIDLAILPIIGAFSRDLVVGELAFVSAPIREGQDALAELPPLLVLPLVKGAVWPRLLPLALLQVFDPLAFILGSSFVGVYSVPVRHVIFPISFIDIAVDVNYAALNRPNEFT